MSLFRGGFGFTGSLLLLHLLVFLVNGDVCPSNVVPCSSISNTRPRPCTACLGIVVSAKNNSYWWEGRSTNLNCVLHGMHSNTPTGEWYEVASDGSLTKITSGVTVTTDTIQRRITTTLAVTVGRSDKNYRCLYSATDGFSLQEYIKHSVGTDASTIRCEISSDGTYYNKFWAFTNVASNTISSSDSGYTVNIDGVWMNLTLDTSATWGTQTEYTCSTSFVAAVGAFKSVIIKALHIVTDALPSVVWSGKEVDLEVTLNSVNPSAESVAVKFGTDVLAGTLVGEKYTGSGKKTFTTADEQSWTVTADFKYPSETATSITKTHSLLVAELQSPTTFVCFKGTNCSISVKFSLSSIVGISSNGQISTLLTNGTNPRTISWTYANSMVEATTILTNVSYEDSQNSYTWYFIMQGNSNLSVSLTLDVAEIKASELTVFDAYTTKVNYKFELANTDFTATACSAKIVKNNNVLTGTLSNNVCTVTDAPVESQSEYEYIAMFTVNSQTISQKVSTDYVVIDRSPDKTIVNVTESNVTMACTATQFVSPGTVSWSCTGEWCEHPSKNMGAKVTGGTEYTDLYTAQDTCEKTSGCTGVTRETRNGISKFTMRTGTLTLSEEDDTSWVEGACASDHSGWVSILGDCFEGTCATQYTLDSSTLEVKYGASTDNNKYVNFFDADREKIGFIKWSLDEDKIQVFDCSDAEALDYSSKPSTSSSVRTWGIYKDNAGIKLYVDSSLVFSYNYRDSAKCRTKYQKKIEYISFNGFKGKTTTPQYLNVQSHSQEKPVTQSNATATYSTYRKVNLTRDTECKCTFKFNTISSIERSFTIKKAVRLTPETYYSLQKTTIQPECSFSVEYSSLTGHVAWYLEDKLIQNNSFTVAQFEQTTTYNITSSLSVQAITDQQTAKIKCKFLFDNGSPSLVWGVGVGSVEFPSNQLVYTSKTDMLTYKCTVVGAEHEPWRYYRSFSGGEEKEVSAVFTEQSWGLTDYTLRCRAALSTQNLTQQFVIDLTAPKIIPELGSNETYVQLWEQANGNITAQLTQLNYVPSSFSFECKDDSDNVIYTSPTDAAQTLKMGFLSTPTSSLSRVGLWQDVNCTFTFVFQDSTVKVPFRVDSYGMINVTSVAVSNTPHKVSFSVYYLRDPGNVNISWNISGAGEQGYSSVTTRNATGVTSELSMSIVNVDKHGKHYAIISSNYGNETAEVFLYVIDIVRSPASFVLQQKGKPTPLTCKCINWRDQGSASWNITGTIDTTMVEESKEMTSTFQKDFTADTSVQCGFSFPNQLSINRNFVIDVFEISEASVEGIAGISSTITTTVTVTDLQDINDAKFYWEYKSKKMEIPNSYWKAITTDCGTEECATAFSFEHVPLYLKLKYDSTSLKTIYFWASDKSMVGSLSWTNYLDVTLSDYGKVAWTSSPNYNQATAQVSWKINIKDQKLLITSEDGLTTYLSKDLKYDGRCELKFCSGKTVKVSFQGVKAQEGTLYDLNVEDRRYMERSNVNGQTGATYKLTIQDLVGSDRGNILFSLEGRDNVSHSVNIGIHAIEFEDGLQKSYTHKKGQSLTLTASIKGFITKPTKISWYSQANQDGKIFEGKVVSETLATTSTSKLTYTFTEDSVVYCKYAFNSMEVTKTYTIDVFDLPDYTALALVGGQVNYDFTLSGLKNISEITTNWTWNGLGGDITDSEKYVPTWESITCGCNSSSCACPDAMNIVTFHVLVNQPTKVSNNSNEWRTVIFYDASDAWITYISWNDQKSKIKMKCNNREIDVDLPPAQASNNRIYTVAINTTHLTLSIEGRVMATDSAQCEGAFVPNDFTKITKVGFNKFLKYDEATKMIKKDQRVEVTKVQYKNEVLSIKLIMLSVSPVDSGDVTLNVTTRQGSSYTSKVNIVYTDLLFNDVTVVSPTSTTVPAVNLMCKATISSVQAFRIDLKCNNSSKTVIATKTESVAKATSELSHSLVGLTPQSCLSYICEFTMNSQTVKKMNNISVIYNVTSSKFLTNEGWSGSLNVSATYLGHDANIMRTCNWTTAAGNGRVYNSTFKKDNSLVFCKSDFVKVRKNDTADIRVVGFNLSKTHFVDTVARLHVGVVNATMRTGINSISKPSIFCNVSDLPKDSTKVTLSPDNMPITTVTEGSVRSDKWTYGADITKDTYPVCTYTVDGFEGKLEGRPTLYVIDVDLVTIAGIGKGAKGRITCNLHHNVLSIKESSFGWAVDTEEVNGTVKFKILNDYDAAKHNAHWYNASSALVMLDVSKESYQFHCFMTFHSERFNYTESFDTLSIHPNHRNFDSTLPAVLEYEIPQKCDSNYVISRNVYDLFNEFHNISSYHLSNVEITATPNGLNTKIKTVMSGVKVSSSGRYYHLCGVDYTVTKNTAKQYTEYLFLPFTINVLDITSIGTYPQSRTYPTVLFFNISNLDDPLDKLSLTFMNGGAMELNITAYEMNKTKTTPGVESTNITVTKMPKEVIVNISVPPDQVAGKTINATFDVNRDIFYRKATLGGFYNFTSSKLAYTTGETIKTSTMLYDLPTTNVSWKITQPFNSRRVNFTVSSTYTKSNMTTSLGYPLYNYEVSISNSKAARNMAGYYHIHGMVPGYGLYAPFPIDAKLGLTIVETVDINVTVFESTTTEAVIELTDYSDLDIVNPVSLTWNPTLPSTFVVSSIKKMERAFEVTLTIKSPTTAMAKTYVYTYTLSTGETFSGNLVLSVIEQSNTTSSKDVCAAEVYTNTIYGILNFPETKSGSTATLFCSYSAMDVNADTATRKCVNGTWDSVNQTLCGSKISHSLTTILMNALGNMSTNASSSTKPTYKTQVSFLNKLKDFVEVNIAKMSGSDLQGVDKIIRTVSNGTVYKESVQLLVDIMNTVTKSSDSVAVDLYSVPSLKLRDTVYDFAMASFNNDTSSSSNFSGTDMSLFITPAGFGANTTVNMTANGKSIKVEMPEGNTFYSNGAGKGYIMATYYTPDKIYQTVSSRGSVISPAVDISLTESNVNTSNLTQEIKIVFELKEKIEDPNSITARYYDPSTSSWSYDGCKVNITSNYSVTAYCNHLTAFAIVTDYVEYTDKLEVHKPKFLGIGVALIFLVIALVLLLPHKILRQDQIIQVHIVLICTLIAANIFLTLAVFMKHDAGAGCDLLGFLANFLWLAVHLWVIIELVLINSCINESYTYSVDKQFARFAGLAFGLSFFIALLGVIIMNVTSYYTDKPRDTCWLNGDALLIFMWIPIIIFVIITLALAAKCWVFLSKKKFKHPEYEFIIIKKTILANVLLVVVLAVGWIFAGVTGAITLEHSFASAQVITNVIFIIVNVLQGVVVCVFYCIFNPKVMDAWRNRSQKDEEAPKTPVDDDVKSRKSMKSGRSIRTVGDITNPTFQEENADDFLLAAQRNDSIQLESVLEELSQMVDKSEPAPVETETKSRKRREEKKKKKSKKDEDGPQGGGNDGAEGTKSKLEELEGIEELTEGKMKKKKEESAVEEGITEGTKRKKKKKKDESGADDGATENKKKKKDESRADDGETESKKKKKKDESVADDGETENKKKKKKDESRADDGETENKKKKKKDESRADDVATETKKKKKKDVSSADDGATETKKKKKGRDEKNEENNEDLANENEEPKKRKKKPNGDDNNQESEANEPKSSKSNRSKRKSKRSEDE